MTESDRRIHSENSVLELSSGCAGALNDEPVSDRYHN